MRRQLVEEPVTRSAVWSPRLGLFAGAVALIGVALMRAGRVGLVPGFAVLAAALVIALAALALALLAFWIIWSEGRRGLGLAIFGFFLAAAILAWPAYMAAKAVYLPQLNDVTTDIADPPAYAMTPEALAARGGRTPGDISRETRTRQREAYPDVAPLFVDASPSEAFAAVRQVADDLGWQVVASDPPGERNPVGHLDAVAHTFLLRFADDVTVRVRPHGDGARIDVRSTSRIGLHDFGANAARIVRFLNNVQEELSPDQASR